MMSDHESRIAPVLTLINWAQLFEAGELSLH